MPYICKLLILNSNGNSNRCALFFYKMADFQMVVLGNSFSLDAYDDNCKVSQFKSCTKNFVSKSL